MIFFSPVYFSRKNNKDNGCLPVSDVLDSLKKRSGVKRRRQLLSLLFFSAKINAGEKKTFFALFL